jgi:hypothetical protein
MNNSYEQSAISKIRETMMSRTHEPTSVAEIIAAARGPTGAENAYAQGLQMAWDGGMAFSEEYMKAAHRQHAPEPMPMEGVDYFYDEAGEMTAFEPLSDNGEDFVFDKSSGESIYETAVNNSDKNAWLDKIDTKLQEKESITSATDSSKSNNEGIASFRAASSGQSIESASSSEQSSGQSSDSGGGESSGQGASM